MIGVGKRGEEEMREGEREVMYTRYKMRLDTVHRNIRLDALPLQGLNIYTSSYRTTHTHTHTHTHTQSPLDNLKHTHTGELIYEYQPTHRVRGVQAVLVQLRGQP
jgi:hypothetical protein